MVSRGKDRCTIFLVCVMVVVVGVKGPFSSSDYIIKLLDSDTLFNADHQHNLALALAFVKDSTV